MQPLSDMYTNSLISSCIFFCTRIDLKSHIQLNTHSSRLIFDSLLLARLVCFQNVSTHLIVSVIVDCA